MPDTHSASSDPASATIPAGAYAIDPERSTVTFRAKAFGLMWVRGRIPLLEGSITISDGGITGTGLLAADRIGTALAPRDWYLRSAHYLHTDEHPTICVAIDGADLSSQSVPCEVTVRGGHGSRPVAAPVDRGGRHTRHHRRGDGGSHRLSDAGPVGRSVTSCEPGHHARRPADRERVTPRIRWCKQSLETGFRCTRTGGRPCKL